MQILCNYVFNWSKQIKLWKLYVSPNLPFFGRLCCCCLWDWHHRVIDVLYPQSETQSAQKKFRCSTDLSTYDYQVKKQTNKQKYGRWNFLKLKYIFEHIGLYGLSKCQVIENKFQVVISKCQVVVIPRIFKQPNRNQYAKLENRSTSTS